MDPIRVSPFRPQSTPVPGSLSHPGTQRQPSTQGRSVPRPPVTPVPQMNQPTVAPPPKAVVNLPATPAPQFLSSSVTGSPASGQARFISPAQPTPTPQSYRPTVTSPSNVAVNPSVTATVGPSVTQDHRELFDLADAGYNPSGAPAGWQRLPDSDFQSKTVDDGSGFRAGVFQSGDRVVVSFAGTQMNSAVDWVTNALQFGGRIPNQYREARALLEEVRARFGPNVTVVGHSLGGGLATYAGLATDTPVVAYNGAGLGSGTIQRLSDEGKLANADALVTNINVREEILSSKPLITLPFLQTRQLGKQIFVDAAVPAPSVEMPSAWQSATSPFSALADIGKQFIDRQIQRGTNHLRPEIRDALDLDLSRTGPTGELPGSVAVCGPNASSGATEDFDLYIPVGTAAGDGFYSPIDAGGDDAPYTPISSFAGSGLYTTVGISGSSDLYTPIETTDGAGLYTPITQVESSGDLAVCFPREASSSSTAEGIF